MLSCHRFASIAAAVTLFVALIAGTAAAQSSDFGTLTIQVRPPDADVLVDGERWVTPENNRRS